MLTDDTVRVLQLINHDEQFEFTSRQANIDTVILNRFDLSDPNYTDQIADLVFSDGSNVDFVAKCECGELEGDNLIGMTCPDCGTKVEKVDLLDDNNLICRNWLEAPKDLVNGWLSPKVYLILSTWLSYDKGRRNYLDDILDVDSDIPFDLKDIITGQGFNYLYDNFDKIIEYFVFHHPIISKKSDTPAIWLCLNQNKEKIFCRYIPILNSAITPIFSHESGGANKKRYSDITADFILRASISLSRLEYSPKKKNHQINVERTAFTAFKDIVTYVEESTKKYVSKKKAIPRTHIFGARLHWSFRGVVVPIVGPHYYYEIHPPWKMAVNTLRVHILGVLCREYGMSIKEAALKVTSALQHVDPDIKAIMDRFIAEAPRVEGRHGIPCLWNRPPSIRDGSVMLKYWTKIKTDINDSSVGITSLDVALPNAKR